MKFHKFLLLCLCLIVAFNTNAQKTLNEGVLIYNMSVETGTDAPKMADMLDGATTSIYLKGKYSRVELVSGLGSEASIYNGNTGSGFILKDYSGQKLLITLSPKDWASNNSKYEGIVFEKSGEFSTISGFSCTKATARLKNGTTFIVYYTTEVNPGNKDYDPQFKTLPGLPVQYEMTSGKMTFKFTLSKIAYETVPLSKFEMPKSGYRLMTYEETKTNK